MTGFPRARRGALLLAAALVLSVGLASSADAFVYWTNGGTNPNPGTTIGRANTDGTNPQQNFITGLTHAPEWPVVDGTHIYWIGINGDVARANLDGTGVNESFIHITNKITLGGLAVDANHIYWTEGTGPGSGSIGRADLDGGNPNPSFISVTTNLFLEGLAVDANHIYWGEGNTGTATSSIGRANLPMGDMKNDSYVPINQKDFVSGVAVNSTDIYWNNLGSATGHATLAMPTSPNNTFIPNLNSPFGITLDGSHLYWTNNGVNSTGTTIGRSDLAGTPSSVNQSFITGASGPSGVAVNSLSTPVCQGASASTAYRQPVGLTLSCTSGGGTKTYSIASPPAHGQISGLDPSTGALTYTPNAGFNGQDSFTFKGSNEGASSSPTTATIDVGKAPNNFTIGKAKLNKKKGTAKLPVTVPGEGSVALAGTKTLKGAVTQASGQGQVTLPVKPKGKAKKKLKKKGKAKVAASVTFAPAGGDPATQGAKVKLKRKR